LIDQQKQLLNLSTEELWTKFKDIVHGQVRAKITSFIPSGRNRPQ
jgi:hypothetical protein